MIRALAITGPTASGKTALSLRLAKDIPLEIISCDSMQIYRGMDIGTAKATPEERLAVPHHLIDVVSPSESYSSGKYRESALLVAQKIEERGRLPLFVGGTGLYVDTLTRAMNEQIPESDPEYRDALIKSTVTEEDKIALWQRLCDVDRESAEAIHYNNVRRVIRAIEVYEQTGRPKSCFDRESRLAEREIDIKMITLDFHNRENLYARVDARVDVMMKEGLLDEVRALYEGGLLCDDTTASRAIGYKELVAHLRGECTLAEAVELIKLSSRRYAKRQLTWFRHVEDARRVYLDTEDGRLLDIEEIYKEVYNNAKELLGKKEER